MKRNNAFLILMLASSLALFACGPKDNGGGQGGDGSSGSGGGAGSSSETSSSEEDSSSSGGSQGESTHTDALKSLSQLEAAIGHHFHFEYHPNALLTPDNTFNQDETIKAATDGTYTALYEAIDTLWVNIDGRSHQYVSLTNGKWRRLGTPTQTTVQYAEARARNTMMQFVDSIEYTTKASTTYLGRSATKYTLEVDEGSQQQGQFYRLFSETIIDNETGLALRHYSKQSGTSSRTLPLSFEVSVLNIGDSADAFIDTFKAKINVYDWDTDWFAAMGITSVARPNEPFSEATKNSAGDEYRTVFKFDGTKEETIAKAKALVQAFYDAGLKCDDNCNVQPSYTDEDIYSEDLDEGVIDFDGYTSAGHYVDFDFTWSEHTIPQYMTADLTFLIYTE